MARHLRAFSNSQVYHIITKGIDNQEIFYDDSDRKKFLKNLKEAKNEFDFKLNAYCLMGNHIHLVLIINNEHLSNAIKNILIKYVLYFNKKYNRIGPLFQDRFKSKNVESLNYFLEVCRYVHRNPEKAGIAITSEYEWSSYKEYIGKSSLVDTSILMHYFNDDRYEFVKFTNKVDDLDDMLKYAEYEIESKLNDDELLEIIMQQFELQSKDEIITYFRNKPMNQKKECITRLKLISGTNSTQLARVTRLNRKLFN